MPETSPLLGGAATLSAMPLFFSPLSAPLSIECHDPTRSWVTVLCGHFSPLSAPLKTFATIPQSHSATIQTRFWVDSSVVPQSNTILGGLFCSATIQHGPGWTLLQCHNPTRSWVDSSSLSSPPRAPLRQTLQCKKRQNNNNNNKTNKSKNK